MKKTLFLFFFSLSFFPNEMFSQAFQWTRSIGSANSDVGYSIAIDDSGNSYITGYFTGTADFDPGAGTATLNAIGSNIFFAKYDNYGNYIWAKSIGSSTSGGVGISITLDSSGNVFITGSFAGTTDFDPNTGIANLTPTGGFFIDIFFAKYDNNGNYIWAKSIGSSGPDSGIGIAIDSTGNVFITGFFTYAADFDPGAATANLISAADQDLFFAKYDNNGNYLWAKSINSNTSNDALSCIALDVAGSVYISSYFSGTADFDPSTGAANLTAIGMEDIFFAKYDNNGNYLWAKNIGGTSSDGSSSVTLDPSGNVFITGYFSGTADFNPGAGTDNHTSVDSFDIFFAKYDSNGNYVFSKSIGSTGIDQGLNIVADDSGNFYINGYFQGTADFDPSADTFNLTATGGNFTDIYFAKYDNNGNYIYSKNIGDSTDIIIASRSIAVDSLGSVFITGYFNDTADLDLGAGTSNLISVGAHDIFFAKYSRPCMTVTTVSTNITCYGANTGSATANAIGGSAPYTYLWSNGDNEAIALNLLAGTYLVTIMDINGCTMAESVIINEPAIIIDSFSSGICNGDSVFLQGNYQTTAGIFYDTLSSVNGCDSVITTTLFVNPQPTVAVTSSNISCTGICDGTAAASLPGGCTPQTYVWSNGAVSAVSTNLCSGKYFVTATQCDGCSTVDSVEISEPSEITLLLSYTPDSGTTTGTATVVTNGGTSPYTYLWSNGATQPAINNLQSATYFVTVTDANGCAETDSVYVSTTVGIQSQNSNLKSQIFVFPNPNDGTFTMKIMNDEWQTLPAGRQVRNFELRIYNILGEEVYKTSIIQAQTTIHLNRSGIYSLQLISENGIETRRVIVE